MYDVVSEMVQSLPFRIPRKGSVIQLSLFPSHRSCATGPTVRVFLDAFFSRAADALLFSSFVFLVVLVGLKQFLKG